VDCAIDEFREQPDAAARNKGSAIFLIIRICSRGIADIDDEGRAGHSLRQNSASSYVIDRIGGKDQ